MLLGCSLFFIFYCNNSMGQTIDKLKEKSDEMYYKQNYDSALYYARLAEPMIIDSFGIQSKEYAYFVGQYYSMNYEKLPKVDSGLYWYLYSIQLFEKLHDTTSLEYGETLTNLGSLYNDIGFYTEAFPFLKKSVRVMEKHKENIGAYLGSLNNLGNYYNYYGEYINAENAYKQIEMYADSLPGSITADQKSTLLYNLATLYTKLGLLTKAEEMYQKARKDFAAFTMNKSYYYKSSNNYALFLIGYGRLKDAKAILTFLCSDSNLTKHNGSNPTDNLSVQYIETLNGLGKLEMIAMHFDKALSLYKQALSIAEKLTIMPVMRYVCMANIASIYAAVKNNAAADSIYEKVMIEFESEKNKVFYNYSNFYNSYCENLIQMGRMKQASNKLEKLTQLLLTKMYENFPFMAEDEQIKYKASVEKHINLIFSALNQNEKNNKSVKFALNNLLQLKGMILAFQARKLQMMRLSENEELLKIFKELHTTRQLIYNKTILADKSSFNMDSLLNIANRYERQIAYFTSSTIENPNTSPSDSIVQKLQPGEAAIEYVRYTNVRNKKEMYGAFILRYGHSNPLFVKLTTEEKLIELLAKNKKFEPTQQLEKSKAAYEIIWKPVEHYFKKMKQGKLYYSPDGLLNYFSFEALQVKPGHFLISDFNMVHMSSTRYLLNKNQTFTLPSVASLWGNIDCSEAAYFNVQHIESSTIKPKTKGLTDEIKNVKRVPFTNLQDDEVYVISKIISNKGVQSKSYVQSKATEENFKENAGSEESILHISSHGFYYNIPHEKYSSTLNIFQTNINPLFRCGLVLNGGNYSWMGKLPLEEKEDGILTGYEIANLDLSKLKLVVLSACETGLGDVNAGSEGVFGLQRAFKQAGAGKILVTLWKVSTTSTTELMTYFYQNLYTHRQLPHDALRNAKKKMLIKNRPPYSWAPFILVE